MPEPFQVRLSSAKESLYRSRDARLALQSKLLPLQSVRTNAPMLSPPQKPKRVQQRARSEAVPTTSTADIARAGSPFDLSGDVTAPSTRQRAPPPRDHDYWASLSSPGREALQMSSDANQDSGPHRDGIQTLDLAFRGRALPKRIDTHQVRNQRTLSGIGWVRGRAGAGGASCAWRLLGALGPYGASCACARARVRVRVCVCSHVCSCVCVCACVSVCVPAVPR